MANNHDYNTPDHGEQDWHVPLNDNFERLDVDVELRDVAANRDDYDPKGGAKFLETDTGIVYEGDGNSWSPMLAMAYYDDGTLEMGELDVTAEHHSITFETDDLSQSIGNGARAVHDGAVVIADSKNTQFWSKGPDEVRSQMPVYAPAFNTTSASAAKTAVEPVDPKRALEGVRSLDVNTWEFVDGDSGRHMGPMAEDFREVFGLGDTDESIATVDADGVALAAIQGLAAENERLRGELEATDETVESLSAETEALRDRVHALEESLSIVEASNSSTPDESPSTSSDSRSLEADD